MVSAKHEKKQKNEKKIDCFFINNSDFGEHIITRGSIYEPFRVGGLA